MSYNIPQKLTTTVCFIQKESSGGIPISCILEHFLLFNQIPQWYRDVFQ